VPLPSFPLRPGRETRKNEVSVTKIIFTPMKLIGGILSGIVAKRTFDRLWRLIDKDPAPEPDQRWATWPRLAAALILQGAVFRAVRGLFDHGSRQMFNRLTGRWPGQQERAESA